MLSYSMQMVIGGVLVVLLLVSTYLALRGNRTAQLFLWLWSGLLVVVVAFLPSEYVVSGWVAGALLLFLAQALYLGYRFNAERLERSHAETRRVLAESNSRVEAERRMISRRLHDDICPALMVCRQELKRLAQRQPEPETDPGFERLMQIVDTAYDGIREIIRNTRVEVLDRIGFTAAVESLVSHYSNCFEKPTIHLT